MTLTETRWLTGGAPAPSAAFTCGYRALAEALKTLALAAAGRKVRPVHGLVLAAVADGGVELSACDADTAVTVALPASAAAPGLLLLDHAALTRVLAAAAKGSPRSAADLLEVSVADDGGVPVVEVAGYGLPLPAGVAASEFAPLPEAPPALDRVARAEFADLAARVAVAAERADDLPHLAGVHARWAGGSLTLAATDRYRLASGSIPLPDADRPRRTEALIPAAPLGRVLARLTGDELRFGAHLDWFTVTDGTTTAHLRCPAAEGDFPDIRPILSRPRPMTVVLPRQGLLRAAERAAALAAALPDPDRRGPVVRLTVTADALVVAPAAADQGRVKAPPLPADVHGRPGPWTAAVRAAFLLDAIGSLPGDLAALHLAGPDDPIELAPGPAAAADYRHLVMPFRLEP